MAFDNDGMTMPFKIVASNGGPHPDAPFVSGFRLGSLHAVLFAARAKGFALDSDFKAILRCEELEQADLIAMANSYATRQTPLFEGDRGHHWHQVMFIPVTDEAKTVPANWR